MRVKPIVSGKSLRVRYRLSLLVSGLLLLAAIAGYGWVSVTNERAVLYANLQAQGEQLQLSLNEKLDIAQSHVFAMRRSAERSLRHPQLTDSGLAERLRQLSLAAPSDAPWDVLPVELEKEVGSLMVDPTGIDATTYTRDLSAALAMLSEVAATHARHQVFQWSYYYNAQRAWTVIYPKIAREEILQVNRVTTMKDALKTLFDEANTAPVTRAGPQRNPERAQVWTAPYLDFGGKGMMVSLLAPVYLAQEFVGVVGTDVTLAMLDTVLQQRPLRLGRALVVDQAGHLLADSQQALKGAQANIRLSDVIAAAPSLLPTREDPAWRQFTLRGTAWTLLLHLPPDVVHAELQTRLRPYFALAVMLVAAILGLAWVQNRRYARPALRLAEYVELLESDAQAPTPRVPTHWQRWFDHLASSARERRNLLAQTQQHASELESKVEQRTADLRRANAELGSAVSALQRTQKQLVRSEKLAALGAMVAGVAHELNTPLGNALLASSTLGDAVQKIQPRLQQGLRKSDLDQFLADVDRAGQLVERNVALASNLVQRFKEVAVHQTREQASRFALFDFTNGVIAGLAPSLRQGPYALVNAIDADIWLHSYPDALGQVLTHLMGNACTHAFEGRDSGEVRLQAQVIHAEQGARVLLTVQDNGCGIAVSDLPHIFEPFFTTRMGRGGIGLGLHVALNLVEGVLGGNIEVSSGTAGTVVTLDLPQDCGTHTT